MEAFSQIAILLMTCAAVGALLLGLRQPVLIAYIVVGIAVGPAGAGLVSAHGAIGLLAELGVAVLLFAVGLKLDIDHVRHIGPVALATGLGQLAFTIVFGFAITLGLGRPPLEAFYVAVALTFSSTIIIVKLLSDKRELDSLHGRIAVGFLIVQDLAVVVAMMAMSALQNPGDGGAAAVTFSIAWRIVAAAAVLAVLMRWVLPTLTAAMARSQELLLIFAVGWGAALAALGEWAGFSREAGAFLAGFSLASTPFREAVHARITGLRDFLLLFFFIDLGAKLELSTLGAEISSSLLLSAFVLIGNPLIVMAIMGYMGYRKRTGFLAGLTVAQISEFSIVFVAMGITLGHVGVQTLGLVTIVGLITIAVSTYMIVYSSALYERLAPLLGMFERRTPFRELAEDAGAPGSVHAEVIVFGVGRYGGRVLDGLHAAGIGALGVDFDPEVARVARPGGARVRFGDGEDPEFLETLPLREARLVVITLPQWESSRALLHALQVAGYAGPVVGAARDAAHARALAAAGVAHVLDPFDDAADHAIQQLSRLLRPQT